jgi:ATP-dependent DNA helicase DinG
MSEAMNSPDAAAVKATIRLPDVPALWVNAGKAHILMPDGEMKTLPLAQAQPFIHKKPVLVCHAPYMCKKMGVDDILAFDVLTLFAFVHPTRFCVPTPAGLAKALDIAIPFDADDYPFTLAQATQALLSDVQNDPLSAKANPANIARVMGLNGRGWPWTPFVLDALGQAYDPAETIVGKADLNIWKHLPEWAEEAPPPPPSHHPVTGEEARARLEQILGPGAEIRQQQKDYASLLTAAFAPPHEDGTPRTVLAEAGTGVGKTLGYLAPSSVWAEKNQGSVWVSTYTKNLQRQIDQELSRLFPNNDIKETKVAVRKGRENYLCLLNLEETAAGASLARNPAQAIAAGIMARWSAATRDGDMQGGDFPGWLAGLLGSEYTRGLSDKRGECLYSACDHYHRCFVEKSVRKSRRAEVVVANHALVMIQTADSGLDTDLPKRYVFDEGHHLFDAADSAFAGHLTAREAYELRRWLRGVEGGKKSRARGLKKRAEDLIEGDAAMDRMLQDILEGARCLTGDGWTKRLKDNQPAGPTENFVLAVYEQVFSRAEGRGGPYSLETLTHPLNEGLAAKAKTLQNALKALHTPIVDLTSALRKKLNDQSDTLAPDTRRRLDVLCTALNLRAMSVKAWMDMLDTLQKGTSPAEFVDWMEIERSDGKTWDIGLYRHWVDPMIPFAAALKPHAHGVVVTSATLRDGTEDNEENWRVARERSGLIHLSNDIIEEKFASPFHYASQTRVIVINDVRKDDMDQVAGAYRALFESSGGGGLGLFTAISRLRGVHERIASKMEEKGLNLYAQHIDAIDNGTLVDIFRDDIHACLLGTDAVRDGVDVPGDSLRLIVFDRVPWPRPTILHKARRDAFGKKRYDDMITRLKLKQAYGRLIRRADDRGVFVMLDSMLPSRLLGAFPETVAIQKLGLAEACAEIKKFLD